MSRLSTLLRRFGLAFVFVSFGIWELANPAYWAGFVPSFATHLIDPLILVRVHGAALILVGLAVLFGFLLRISAALAVIIMLEIVSSLWFQAGFTDIFARDVAILFLAGSIFVESLSSSPHYANSKKESTDAQSSG
ncbi:MAG: DoxX family membrane protein [Candidatus Uhrbacteria bacterium]|nr:DoxX family membrane protein [Candidatus Uhrbacteria bacterium]